MPQIATEVLEHGSLAKGWPRRYRWIAVAAAVIAVAIAIAGIYAVRHWPFTEEKVKQSLEEQFAGTATFTGFRKTFLPHPGCVLQGLTITPDEKARNGTLLDRAPLVKTEKLIVMAHYWDVILRPGVVAHVRAVGLQVHIPADGGILRKDNTQSHTLGEAIANDALLEIAKEKGEPLRFAIHRLTMKSVGLKEQMGYDVAFRNAVPEGEIESRGYFGPWNSGNPGATPVSGTYQYSNADLGKFGGISGILTSHDAFQGTLEKITTHGTVEVPEFKLRRAGRSVSLASRFDAAVDALNGDVHLDHVENRIEKTNVLAHGDVAGKTGQKGKTTSLELNVSQGRIQDILRLFIKEHVSPISGITSFRAHVTVPPEGKPFEQEVMLTGDFGIEEQRFTKPNTRKEVENLSERARGQKPNEDDDDDPAGVVTNLKGHVELRNGVATLSNIAFTFPGGTAQGHGTFNLRSQKIDFHGTLKTDAELSKMNSGIKSVFLKPFDAIFKKKPKGSEIPVKLTGTYEHPEPGLEITGGKKEKK
jgi:AsmA-like protein